MNRFYILSLFVLSCFHLFPQENNIYVMYKTSLEMKEPEDISKNETSQIYSMVIDEISNLEFEFIYNKEKSVFKEVKSLELDNKTRDIRRMAKTLTGSKGIYYSDLTTEVALIEREFQGELFIIKSGLTELNWTLVNETKTIKGFNCYKAMTKVKYKDRSGNFTSKPVIAWYTTSIPITLGPKNYNGLPGLILMLIEGSEDRGIIYYASKISQNSNKLEDIILPVDGNIVTRNEFDDIAEKAFANIKEN